MHPESERVVGAHCRNSRVLYQGAEVSGVYAASVWCSSPELGCEGLPLFNTARGEINNPVQIVGYQGPDHHFFVVHPAIVSSAPV
jgi:hypothetical protein